MEMNLQNLFSKVLLVYARPAQQVARLTARDGITRASALKILASQMPIDEKLPGADYVIDNGGIEAETRRQVKELWPKLQQQVH